MSFDRIPSEMRAYPHFVVWRYETRFGSDKPTKNLYSPRHGGQADVSNPATWGTYDEAVATAATGRWAGIGFVFSDDDPFAGIDLDDCEGDQDEFARQARVFDEFQSYAELSREPPVGAALSG